MHSVQGFREFICDRLTAAALEIFTVFEQTVVQYESEIDRQRQLLDNTRKREREAPRSDSSQENDSEDLEAPSEQLFNNEEASFSPDQEPSEFPQIKLEPDELYSSQERQQLLLKFETEAFAETPSYEAQDDSDREPYVTQFFAHTSAAMERQEQNKSKDADSKSPTRPPKRPNMRRCRNRTQTNSIDGAPVSDSQTDTSKIKTAGRRNIREKARQGYSNRNKQGTIQTGEKPYCCEACGKSFRDRYTLSVHMRTHTGEKPYTCNTCGKCYRNKHGLVNHMRNHTGERPYVCKTCGKCYKHSSGLSYHMKSHTSEELHSCKKCGKNFKEDRYLLIHMRAHTNKKPYCCKICSKSFRLKSYLLAHVRTHTGEKPYTCEICDKSFRISRYLMTHMRTHTGEKPYDCETCGKKFSQHCNLLAHQNSHIGEPM